MLTLLFLIRQWFYAKPKPPSIQVITEESFQPHNQEFQQGSDVNHPKCQKINALLNFYSTAELAVVAVCRISTTASPLSVSNLESLNTPSTELSKMSMEEKFRAAVRVIHSLPKDGPYQPSNSTKLKFYGLYKQATEGKAIGSRPGFWDVIGRAKWDAWSKLGDMTNDQAMNEYVDCLKEIVETMSFNGDVEDFLDSIGPFYEFVTLQGSDMNHIKEKIEEVTSSSGGSSPSPSAEGSKDISPTKTSHLDEIDNEEEEVSSSEKAEVIVETTSATYERSQKNYYSTHNGHVINGSNKDDGCEQPVTIPPPAPVHSYAHQNGFVKRSLPSESDEVLTVSTPYVHCKEDLERDTEGGIKSHCHVPVRITSSVETVASNATSGTESEKYYSGDSEPEVDDKIIASPTSTILVSQCLPSTSAAASQQLLANQMYISDSSNHKKMYDTSPIKKSKERISPKSSSSTPRLSQPDAVVQQTVERLNRDVDHILARLRILEAAYAAGADGVVRVPSMDQHQSGSVSRSRRRIFGDLSPQSIAFIVMWPFFVQFMIKLLRWWWRRRRILRSRNV